MSAGDPTSLKTAVPVRGESMEFAVPTRRKSLPPPTDEHRHPFLEGDAPAPYVPVKRATPATALMQSGMPEWRPSVRQMQPVSANAAGMTDARRAEIAARAMGAQLLPSRSRPMDGREASPPRGRSFTKRSHLLHVDRVPYGHDEREEKAPNSPRRQSGGSSPCGGARVHKAGGSSGYPYPFDDDDDVGAISYEREDRNVRGFGLDEADCFGRAPSPRRHRSNWQHESHFSFADEGTRANENDQNVFLLQKEKARNLERTASLDARAQEEERFRTLKARGPEYAWVRRDAAVSDPNALWGSGSGSAIRDSGDGDGEKAKGGRSLGPRRDAASLEAEREARVVGVEWGSAPPEPTERERRQRLGSPRKAKNDAWGLNPESVGAIQLGAGVYSKYAGAEKDAGALSGFGAASKFTDPRASEKAAHEKALYASTAARFDDSVLAELAANRTQCEAGGAGRVLGHFLYEARGEEATAAAEDAAARERAARARPPSPKRAEPEKTDMFGVLAGG